MIKRIAVRATSLALALLVGAALSIPTSAHAARKKVDCDQVMTELNGGKKVKDVAKDLGISTSSVYRCRKKATAAASATGAKTAGTSTMSGKPAASPAAAASPAH